MLVRCNHVPVVICFHFTIFVVLETTDDDGEGDLFGLWFAFILLSLSYWKQHKVVDGNIDLCCDLLSFYYLCRTGNNIGSNLMATTFVVICFHFTIFVVLETTTSIDTSVGALLWFAFILLSLSYWKQHIFEKEMKISVVICFHFTIFVVLETTSLAQTYAQTRCDLLSFYYLCRTGNNHGLLPSAQYGVVICFHFTIFVVLETTATAFTPTKPALWFAFILLSLSYWKQPIYICTAYHMSCDLLSFYYLCRTGNNFSRMLASVLLLWFAFILLSLSYWKQHSGWSAPFSHGCDLLSFYYLCRTGNNPGGLGTAWGQVVICFHFTIFVVLETTADSARSSPLALWFAFILLSLSYWKQHYNALVSRNIGCDLLSFYYLCRTGNNVPLFACHRRAVVICFHFTIFVVLETTESILFVVFQHVIKIIGIQKMLLLIECNPADWRDYIFWLNLRTAPIAARERWQP